jgi:hypothetical protein
MRQHIDSAPTTRLVAAGQASLADLATHIRNAHVSVVSAFASAIENAIEAGKLLIAAKAQTPHGGWSKFLKKCNVGERQAERYAHLARLIEAKPSSRTDLAGLSIQAAIKKLSPPKLLVTPKQSNDRKPNAPPAPKTEHADILAAWVNAPIAERTRAIEGIGLAPLLPAVPSEWLPLMEKHIADRQKPPAPIVEAIALPENDLTVPNDLSIPNFLKRGLPPSLADATPEIPDTSTAENADAHVDGVEDGAEDDGADDEFAEFKRRAAERARKVKLVEHTAEIGNAIHLVLEDLEELKSHCREVVESAPENLQASERIQTLENSADQLEDLCTPEVSDDLGRMSVTYSLPKRRYASREARAPDATTILEACTKALARVPDGDEHHANAQTLIVDLQSAIDAVEGCEFPGAYQ